MKNCYIVVLLSVSFAVMDGSEPKQSDHREPKQRGAMQKSTPEIRVESNGLASSNPISIVRPRPQNGNRSRSISPTHVVQYSPDMCSLSPNGKFIFSPSRYWQGYGDLTDTDQEASPSTR